MTIYMKVEKKRKVEFSLGSRNSGEKKHLHSFKKSFRWNNLFNKCLQN